MRFITTLLLLLYYCSAEAQPLPRLIPFRSGQQWGYADSNGKIVLPPLWDQVYFFEHNKAVVSLKDETNANRAFYCLIDTNGHYIIPPSRHWAGFYNGWSGALNATDSTGRWGMIDTNNQVIIPFEWEARNGSLEIPGVARYKAVYRDGLAGVLDTNNQLIIPCTYGSISILSAPEPLFLVTAKDGQNTRNQQGVIDLQQRLLVPMQYQDISYIGRDKYKGFRVAKVKPNPDNELSLLYDWFWIDYGTLKVQKTVPQALLQEPVQPAKKQYGYITSYTKAGLVLKDTNGRTLIPCCAISAINQDTITLIHRDYRGHDSLVLTYTYLDTRTRKPLAPDKILYQYYRKEEPFSMSPSICGNGARAMAAARERERNLPEVYVNEQWTKTYFRDSLRCHVSGFMPICAFTHADGINMLWGGGRWGWMTDQEKLQEAPYIFVTAYNSRMQSYQAIVDRTGQYIIPPTSWYIDAYDPTEDLLCVHSSMSEHALLNRHGDTLSPISDKEYRGGFRTGGKLYTYIATSTTTVSGMGGFNNFDDFRVVRRLQLADNRGQLIPALQAYTLIDVWAGKKQEPLLIIADSSGRKAISKPDGTLVFTAISFRFKDISRISDNYFLVKDSTEVYGRLVDTCGTELVPGLKIRNASPVNRPYFDRYRNNPANVSATLPGIWELLYLSGAKDQTDACYIDRNGRLYNIFPAGTAISPARTIGGPSN